MIGYRTSLKGIQHVCGFAHLPCQPSEEFDPKPITKQTMLLVKLIVLTLH